MFRTLFAAVVALSSLPAVAQEPGDFDCVTSLNGPDTPGGILRVERDGERGRFSFLDASAVPGHWSTVEFFDEQTILFDDALASHFSAGAIMADARWDAPAFAYAGNIVTATGDLVPFSCPLIP